ncbi:MAG: SCO family protein [Novosphingobium sp.]|nr:SCO family protein [Novosphingobium sp.]
MNRRAMPRLATTIFVAALLSITACSPGGDEAAQPPLAGAKIGGNFSLIDKGGKPVRFSDFAGQYRIVYFGFTFCPDACPLDMQKLMQGYAKFAQAEPEVAARVQPLFVSIDPARDTPSAVGEFAAAFSPKLIGLTGSEEQVVEAVKMFAGYARKGEPAKDGSYAMDHSRFAYLMDPEGKPIGFLPIDQSADAVARDLARWTS